MKYWKASRPYSFTAALVPVFIGTAMAKLNFPSLSINWLYFALVLLGCVGAQAISNLVNDLADTKNGLDKPGETKRYHGILSGDSTWMEIFYLVVVIGVVSLAIGIYLAAVTSWNLLWLILISAFLAVEYTAPPLKLKYRALGDFTVLLTFGLGMVVGAYYVQAFAENNLTAPAPLIKLLLVSLPSAFHVVAILQANNHRDRESDRSAGARTVANLLPFSLSKGLLIAELTIPYAVVIVAVLLGQITAWCLLAMVTIPPLIAVLKPIASDDYKRTVPSTAKLHGQFGLLVSLGLVIQAVLSRQG